MVWITLLVFVAQSLNIYELSRQKVFASFVKDKMSHNGYAVLSDASLRQPVMLSETLQETAKFYETTQNFSYTLGNVHGRTLVDPNAPGVFHIGGAPNKVLVSGHSEASYLSLSPRFLMFTCFQEAESGGQTPLYNIKALQDYFMSSEVGRKMYYDVYNLGVTYIRNDPSQDGHLADAWGRINYPTWQSRFPGQDREEILDMLQSKGMVAFFDGNDTLHSEWTFAGVRPHPDTGEMVWFNQLYGMSGYYWRQHGDAEILSLPLDQRPLSTRIGTLENNRPLSEAEFNIMDSAHFETAEMFNWAKGIVMFVDNFAFQHGRMPYEGTRSCAVAWGPPVDVKETFVTKSMPLKSESILNSCFSRSQHLQSF